MIERRQQKYSEINPKVYVQAGPREEGSGFADYVVVSDLVHQMPGKAQTFKVAMPSRSFLIGT